MLRPLAALVVLLLASCNSDAGRGATPTTATTTTVTTIPVELQIGIAVERAIDDGVLCVDAFVPDDDLAFEPEHVALDSGNHLVGVVCETYAYQLGYQFAIWDGEALGPVEAPWFDSASGEVIPMQIVAGFASFSDAGVQLFTKYRGLGDCGAVAEYVVVDDLLRLVRFAERECSLDFDESAGDTATWPIVYERPTDR